MKTLIKHSLIVILLCMALSSYATGVEPFVKVGGRDSKAFTLIMNDLKSRPVNIFIKEEDGTVLHRENLSENTEFLKHYDLSALPNGNYFLEVEDQSVVKIMPFQITKSMVLFSSEDQSQVFKPYLRQRGMLVDAMFQPAQNNYTRVITYDEEGNLIETDKVEAGKNVEKVFDFSNLKEGTYRISFHSGDRIFPQDVTLTR